MKKTKLEKPYRIKVLKNMKELLDAIGSADKAKNPNEYFAEYQLWDSRIVRAELQPSVGGDVHFGDRAIRYDELLPYVEGLLAGKPLVISTGTDDLVCTLKWTISDR